MKKAAICRLFDAALTRETASDVSATLFFFICKHQNASEICLFGPTRWRHQIRGKEGNEGAWPSGPGFFVLRHDRVSDGGADVSSI
jgi:hypothetical protein